MWGLISSSAPSPTTRLGVSVLCGSRPEPKASLVGSQLLLSKEKLSLSVPRPKNIDGLESQPSQIYLACALAPLKIKEKAGGIAKHKLSSKFAIINANFFSCKNFYTH